MVETPKHLKKVKQKQIFHFSLFTFHYSLYLCTRLRKARAFSSAGLEHLPYKQRVGGSNPSTPTKKSSEVVSELFFILCPSPFILPPSTLLHRPSSFHLPPSYIVLRPSTFNLPPSYIVLRPSTFHPPTSSFVLPPSTLLHHPSSFNPCTSPISLTAASTVGISAMIIERRPFCSRN